MSSVVSLRYFYTFTPDLQQFYNRSATSGRKTSAEQTQNKRRTTESALKPKRKQTKSHWRQVAPHINSIRMQAGMQKNTHICHFVMYKLDKIAIFRKFCHPEVGRHRYCHSVGQKQ